MSPVTSPATDGRLAGSTAAVFGALGAVGALLLGTGSAVLALLARALPPTAAWDAMTLDDMVVSATAAIGCLLVVGLAGCLGSALLEALVATIRQARSCCNGHRRTGQLAAAGAAPGWRCPTTPAWARRLVFAVCGLGLLTVPVTGVATADVGLPRYGAAGTSAAVIPTLSPSVAGVGARMPAGATDGDDASPHRCGERLAGLPLPDLPAVDVPPAPPRHRVVPGESLWTIAAAQLPPSATDAGVARRTRQLYRANRDVIGDDPDLIFPGTLLAIPEAPS